MDKESATSTNAGLGAPRRYSEWHERSPRWANFYSETIHVDGVEVHLLRADARPTAPEGAPTHLLIHPMGASGTWWLDVIGPLSAYGPVIVPDLPGSLAGRTTSPHRNAAHAEEQARFLARLITVLELEHTVVHGWSLGGLEALLFVALQPRGIDGLVLVNAPLPGPLTRDEQRFWQTVGRFALWVGPPTFRLLFRVFGSKLATLKMRRFTQATEAREALSSAGGDLSRLSPEVVAMLNAEIAGMLFHARQARDAVTAFASVISCLYLNRRPAEEAIARIEVPTLLLWGDDDPLITRPLIEHLTERRPDWTLHIFETVGHLLPLEVPDAYVEVVGRWLEKQKRAASPSA